jgi:hypothetical protein
MVATFEIALVIVLLGLGVFCVRRSKLYRHRRSHGFDQGEFGYKLGSGSGGMDIGGHSG